MSFSQSVAQITAKKRVKSITVDVIIQDCTGTLYVTDMQLQGGSTRTGWMGHPSEIQWVLDN